MVEPSIRDYALQSVDLFLLCDAARPVAATPQPLPDDANGKDRQNELPPPAPRLEDQPIEPLQTHALDKFRGASCVAGEKIERPTDSDHKTNTGICQGCLISHNPCHLTRRAIGDQDHSRLRQFDPSQRLGVICRTGRAIRPPPCDPRLGTSPFQRLCRFLGDAGFRAKEVQRCGQRITPRGKPLGNVDAGDATKLPARYRIEYFRRDQNSDSIGRDQIGRRDTTPKVRVALSSHHVFRVERGDLPASAIPGIGKKRMNPRSHVVDGQRVERHSQHGESRCSRLGVS